MSRYDWWKPLAVVAIMLLAVVTIAKAENPDGPVGAVMLEPSITLSGIQSFDGFVVSRSPRRDDDDLAGTRESVENFGRDGSAQRYGFRLLVPAREDLTVGLHYAYAQFDRETSALDELVDEDWSGWEFGFRVRYWWNLPE